MFIKNTTKIITVLIAGIMILLSPVSVYAQANSKEACEGVKIAGGNCDDPAASGRLDSIISDIVNVLSVVVGIVATIMIMIGGFKYITSNGDSNQISSAKNTILYAIVGIVVVVFAQVIVRFVINKV